jgi:arabinogalactan endo-1,4-beta-galactosidase
MKRLQHGEAALLLETERMAHSVSVHHVSSQKLVLVHLYHDTNNNFYTRTYTSISTIQVCTEMKISVVVFWVTTLCSLTDFHKRFGETYRVSLRDTVKMEAIVHSETLVATCKTTQRHNPEE